MDDEASKKILLKTVTTSSLYMPFKRYMIKKTAGGLYMKAHKYWSIGALITMIGTFYTGYKGRKEGHKYFAASSLICMIMAIYTGHKMISGKGKKKKDVSVEVDED